MTIGEWRHEYLVLYTPRAEAVRQGLTPEQRRDLGAIEQYLEQEGQGIPMRNCQMACCLSG